MTTDVLLALALGASIILNAMQASKAQEWRNSLREAAYKIEVLTRPIEDAEAIKTGEARMLGVLEPGVTHVRYAATSEDGDEDWLTTHPGVQPKPGYERKRR